MQNAPPEFLEMLQNAGLAEPGEAPFFEELTGGVASDIWRADLASGPVCVKRALAKLKVPQDWRAPVERNTYEAAWFETVAAISPGVVPRLLAQDRDAGMFAMEYLDPDNFKSWKDELLEGRADPGFAAEVGRNLGLIHSATKGDEKIREQFPTDDIFHAIRLSPYLEATATKHPALKVPLLDLVRVTGATHQALVHGDVSPKNILIGPDGPVFLDAECAWYGDPAFDLAFCLNHMLLKCLAAPAATGAFLDCFSALAKAYLETVQNEVNEEWAIEIETRTARLLPGLFLARIDGKSPVEYIDGEFDKDAVRLAARTLLMDPVKQLSDVRRSWAEQLRRGPAR
ncbi:MAG: phosphotransferase [Rhodospirillales bacterium]|nr:phosphotransferase [Rhodospirillales bacterium]